MGYPLDLGFKELETKVELREPHLDALKNLLPVSAYNKLRFRGSPDPARRVLSIQGDLLHGHSGAALLDSEDRLVGIGNGGLSAPGGGGSTGICWAIPFAEVAFEDVDEELKKRLDSLGSGDGLFSVTQTLGKPVDIKEVRQRRGGTTVWAKGQVSRQPSDELQIQLTLKVRKSGFAGTGYGVAIVELLDIEGNVIWESEKIKKQAGANTLTGTVTKDKRVTLAAPRELAKRLVGARVYVGASETSGLGDQGRDLMESLQLTL